jgi:hypothetical protein
MAWGAWSFGGVMKGIAASVAISENASRNPQSIPCIPRTATSRRSKVFACISNILYLTPRWPDVGRTHLALATLPFALRDCHWAAAAVPVTQRLLYAVEDDARRIRGSFRVDAKRDRCGVGGGYKAISQRRCRSC